MRDRFDGVQAFVEAVETGGFAKAADRLSLTRSAVGKAIARLEERLGVRLFHRTTRTQSLTEDGQQYYERCIRAIEELRAGESLLESGRREVVGRLRVSLPVLFGRYCAAPILRAYARQHEKLELELSFSDRQIDLIADGFDLAVRNGALGNGTALHARRLASPRKALCASPGYLSARGEPHSLADLSEHETLVYWRNDHGLTWQLPDATGALIDLLVTSRLRFDDLEVIADAAVDGMGLAWLPYWLIHERVQAGELIELWADRPRAAMECYAVWPTNQYLPLRSRLAIDALATELPKRFEF
ncbi:MULTISPECIES: LysR family transcriptional regulator [Rhizobium]|uniref:LysR family transcriptional regulator n=1 Tax=Rhizobium TaxID=379 RepID=UPI0003F88A9D|nr:MULTISPECIES: LysR family transcriptional regulator [Rhizobium]KZS51537.1 LysR family transcriptional regulator [Rhizobium anhuiense bv. trifolii]MBB3299508.1 DNA-binding transcriptional LysR family regulator [Rhizobium sp. BK112]MBB3369224.1 DNA-binding transcriptional LysR family regulator [Rhizobium sp. BK077]MBB4113714.1 DNA-binding transcriptional LysR family regulator [Rhizobium sp. BK226]MBB4179398.1 DNA-binding transcriptional LysR family regulator [Rhizobium sp. BK109]